MAGFVAPSVAAPFLYSVRSNADHGVYRIDPMTGIATSLGVSGLTDAEGLAFAGGNLLAIGGTVDALWNISVPPGVAIGPTGPRLGIDSGLDYDITAGVLYNVSGGEGSSTVAAATSTLYRIDLASGAATLVGTNSVFLDGLAIDGAGTAYAIDAVISDTLYALDLATGAATVIGAIGTTDTIRGIAFAGDALYGISVGGNIYTLDTATGAAALLSSVNCGGQPCNGWEGLAAQNLLPEPGTLALLGLGLIALARRKRRP